MFVAIIQKPMSCERLGLVLFLLCIHHLCPLTVRAFTPLHVDRPAVTSERIAKQSFRGLMGTDLIRERPAMTAAQVQGHLHHSKSADLTHAHTHSHKRAYPHSRSTPAMKAGRKAIVKLAPPGPPPVGNGSHTQAATVVFTGEPLVKRG